MKYRAFLALILAALLLLSGCGNSPDDTTPDTTEPPASDKLELPKEVRLSGHRLLDICPTEGGYLLLSVDIWGWHLTTLDENLTVGETVDLSKEDPSPYRILEAGGHRWTLENDGDMESANYGCGVYCDGEFMMQTERDPALMQLAWADDTLYTVHFHRLWCGKNEVEMPDQPGANFWVRCVLQINGQSYAMVTAWTEVQGTDERTSVGRWLCPIDGTTTQLSLPESEFPILVDRACWNDAGTWVLSGSKLYETDGTNVTELCDLAAWGLDFEKFSTILALEDGTFLVMDWDRLVHVDPSENKGDTLTIGLYHPDYHCSQAIAAFNLADKVHDDPITKTQARTLFPFPVGSYTGLGLNSMGFYAIVNGSNTSGGQAFMDFLFADEEWFDEPQVPADFGSEFPVNLSHLDEFLQRRVSQNPTDEFEQDARELRELLLNADHLMDPLLGEPEQIILEEAEAYFNGDVTVEECARRIQNRIEIYLSERG